ncbi:ABC transporter substrate-binding protein [Desulfocucumis palustris]|uniref:ABC transporter substrate-binding protein n=1 Tax=Desulfocucumis palustris TaxID=1898651 RepID=A0A2L2XG29_9FIRM|nr:ABC transporter substrate-binding protein [Desulfocucumis palustris]GBF35165.1 ABC transporter substrate-binding protein [Desulfocucumis palustris]
MQRRALKGLIVLLVFIFIAALLTGCGKPETRGTSPQKVKIGYSRLIISLPVFVAEERGIFRENGLDVELEGFDTAQPLMDALLAGQLDVAGYTAFPITFNGQVRSKKQLYYLTALVEDDKHPISMLMVKKDSPVSGINDLRGRRIGILPTVAYKAWLNMILQENGISPDEVVIQTLAPALTASSLDSGAVDAVFSNDPAVTTTLQKGIGRLLYQGAIVPKYLWSPLPFGSFNVSKEFADKDPDMVERIAKSLDEAIEFIDANPREAKKMMAGFVSDTEKPFVENYSDPRYLKTGEVSPGELSRLVEAYQKQNIIKGNLDLTNMLYKYPQ